ncbi:hypothetical protein GCM10023144_13430 [Pigmentiphaga soli]|uniref:Uncharacterized protein n=1 Tax=Pigmentiphaga soli TaxID=1007095 RepID=A0ABP8GPN6_9BURK
MQAKRRQRPGAGMGAGAGAAEGIAFMGRKITRTARRAQATRRAGRTGGGLTAVQQAC